MLTSQVFFALLFTFALGYLVADKIVPYVRIHRERKKIEEMLIALVKDSHAKAVDAFLNDIEAHLKHLYQQHSHLDQFVMAHVIERIRRLGEAHFPRRFKAMWVGNTTGYEITVIIHEDIFVITSEWVVDPDNAQTTMPKFIPVFSSN